LNLEPPSAEAPYNTWKLNPPCCFLLSIAENRVYLGKTKPDQEAEVTCQVFLPSGSFKHPSKEKFSPWSSNISGFQC
jgi:hypothetical protein